MKRYVVCLKHGNKYSSEYVNKLYHMVQRNLTLDHEFVCFTENSQNLDPGITIRKLHHVDGVTGWWYKTMFFNPEFPLQGTILFLDLDLIIFRNIDYLFDYEPGKFCIIRDFNRQLFRNYKKFNSSVFRLNTGDQSQVYDNFKKDPKGNSKRYLGDQDWIFANVSENFAYWPTEWIQSYKWEMRDRPALDKKMPKGSRDFVAQGEPTILENTSIATFHGDPNPHICQDPWVKANWG